MRQLIEAKRVIIYICFSCSGIGSLVLPPSQEAFNLEFFVGKVLADFNGEWAYNQLKHRSKGTFLHLANATPHRAL
jgi:hypothetical protein